MHLEGSFIAIPMALPMVDLQLSPLWEDWTQRSKKSWQKSTDWKYLNDSVKRPKLPTLSLKLAGKWNCCLLDICASWIILKRSFLIQWLYHLILYSVYMSCFVLQCTPWQRRVAGRRGLTGMFCSNLMEEGSLWIFWGDVCRLYLARGSVHLSTGCWWGCIVCLGNLLQGFH